MPFPAACYKPVGTPQQGTGAGVITLTQGAYSTAVMITASTNSVYWTFDGTTPSSSAGVVIQANAQPLVLPIGPSGATAMTHRFQAVSGSATVNLQALSS